MTPTRETRPSKEPTKRDRKPGPDRDRPLTDVIAEEIDLEPYWSAILDAATD